MKKLEAINGDKIRALTIEDFLQWALPFLISSKVITGTDEQVALVKKALPIIQERIVTLERSNSHACISICRASSISMQRAEAKICEMMPQKVVIAAS